MSGLRYITPEEQIAAIDAAVEAGWIISSVEVDGSGNATVRFSMVVQVPAPPIAPKDSFPGVETVTREFGCGLLAVAHAKEIMKAAISLDATLTPNEPTA